jgi:glyoxylase I family protein
LSKETPPFPHKEFAVTGLDHVVLRSHVPERLAAFYTTLLSVPVERTVDDFLWQLRIGDSLLDIIRVQQAEAGANMDHFCLRVAPYNEDVLLNRLRQQGVEGQVTGRIYGAQGFGPSIYFIDPQGNRVELKQHKDQSD